MALFLFFGQNKLSPILGDLTLFPRSSFVQLLCHPTMCHCLREAFPEPPAKVSTPLLQLHVFVLFLSWSLSSSSDIFLFIYFLLSVYMTRNFMRTWIFSVVPGLSKGPVTCKSSGKVCGMHQETTTCIATTDMGTSRCFCGGFM